MLEDIRTGIGHLDAVHLKETVPGVFREVPFGTGHVDFPAVIAETWKAGVRRYGDGILVYRKSGMEKRPGSCSWNDAADSGCPGIKNGRDQKDKTGI